MLCLGMMTTALSLTQPLRPFTAALRCATQSRVFSGQRISASAVTQKRNTYLSMYTTHAVLAVAVYVARIGALLNHWAHQWQSAS